MKTFNGIKVKIMDYKLQIWIIVLVVIEHLSIWPVCVGEDIPQAIWCIMAVWTLIQMTKMDTNKIALSGSQQQSNFHSVIKGGPSFDSFLDHFVC